jgi:hypothetical protein
MLDDLEDEGKRLTILRMTLPYSPTHHAWTKEVQEDRIALVLRHSSLSF